MSKWKRMLCGFGTGLLAFVMITDSMDRMQGEEVVLAEGTYTRWIDRIIIPEWGEEFYQWLWEATDGDGMEDRLIEDKYFNADSEEGYRHPIVTITYPSREAYKEDSKRIFALIRAIYDAFDRDAPQVFWLTGRTATTVKSRRTLEGQYEYTYYFHMKGQVGKENFDIRIDTYGSEAAIKEGMAKLGQVTEQIMSQVQGKTNEEKLRWFNRWLTENNRFYTGEKPYPAESMECISALEGNVGEKGPVCEAYARAYKVLCDKVGIPCVLVGGKASTNASGAGEEHLWNCVQLEGNWYGVDVTWNDPVTGKQTACSGRETDKWLFLGEDTIVNDNWTFGMAHQVTNRGSVNGVSFVNGPPLSDKSYEEVSQLQDLCKELLRGFLDKIQWKMAMPPGGWDWRTRETKSPLWRKYR